MFAPEGPYDPRSDSYLLPPGVAIDAAPVVVLCVNVEWAKHLDGLLERLLYEDAWSPEADPEDVYEAIQQVRWLLTRFVIEPEGCP